MDTTVDWAALPSTAKDAKRLGLRLFFTEEPCARGHVAPRQASNRKCVLCEAMRRAERGEARRAEREEREAARDAEIDEARSRCADPDLLALPRSGAEARALGVMEYFTGLPCSHGHVAAYTARNNTCVVCAKRHSDEWYDANLRPVFEERRAKREAERPARQAAARERNRQWARERPRQRMLEEGTEEVLAEQATHTRERYWADPEKHRARRRERTRVGVSGARSLILRTPPWLTDEERWAIEAFYDDCPPGHEVDHIVPIDHRKRIVGGLHVPWNLQYLVPRQNVLKEMRRPDWSPADAVARGSAVWSEDIDEHGSVAWDKYPRPALAPSLRGPAA